LMEKGFPSKLWSWFGAILLLTRRSCYRSGNGLRTSLGWR
jgi:hypothetical protein